MSNDSSDSLDAGALKLIEDFEEIRAFLYALDLPIIVGEVLDYSGFTAVLITMDELKSLLKKNILSEGSLLVIEDLKISKDNFPPEHIELAGHLTGQTKTLNAYIRQSTTNTWFVISEDSPYSALLEMLTENSDDDSDCDLYGEDWGDNGELDGEIRSKLAKSIAVRDSFGVLRNRQERNDYAKSVIAEEFAEDVDSYGISMIANLAESYRELGVMPRLCKKLNSEGQSNKEIGEKLSITAYKVGRYLNTDIPSYIEDALGRSIE